MDTFILLFKRHRAWLGRCLGLLVGVLMMAQQGWTQIYSGGYSSAAFKYYDVATNTWTTKASAPVNGLYSLTAFQGKIYGTKLWNVYIYDPTTNQWSTVSNTNVQGTEFLLTVGNYIYTNGGSLSSTDLSKYDPATNTLTPLASTTSGGFGYMAHDGGDYIYAGSALGYTLKRYSISGNTWAALPSASHLTDGVAFKNGKIYLSSRNETKFSAYDPATNSYTSLADPPFGLIVLMSGEGNYLYGGNTSGFARYDISTNTWTTLSGQTDINIAYVGASCEPTATATATQATCATGGGANANAALTLSVYGGGVTKVGYSAGSNYMGPDFTTATAVTASPMILTSTLANPVSDQPYTIRVFKDATCYKDVLVTLNPKKCITGNCSLAISPAQLSANRGEIVNFTITLTNTGPDAVPNMQVRVPIPTNTTLLTTTPQQGTYSPATHKWDIGTMPVGNTSMTVTLKMN